MPVNYSGHDILEDLAPVSFYPRWIMRQITPFLGKKIIEVGAGLGTMSALLPAGANIVLTDNDPAYIRALGKKYSYPCYLWDAQAELPGSLKPGSFDTAVSINVLEHISDDKAVLRNIFRLLTPSGRLLLYVPAMPGLFGDTDRVLGHKRRYSKLRLRNLLENAGFRIQILKYCNLPGFFAWALVSRVFRVRRFGKLPLVFDKFFAPWLSLEANLPIPFGQNLLAVAVKPDRT